LFQKFHRECVMRFANNIWPSLRALAAAAFAPSAPAVA
jgi:hypothetical protein